LKKIMLVVALLAIVLIAAAPAIAQVTQPFKESNIKSGKASPSASISNAGDNANLCPTAQQIAQTGNVANEQGVVQYDIQDPIDIPFTGSSITVTPDVTGTCDQSISQTAAG
jgi:ABC-type oligopeptide transport system substrate-binding subunit